MASWISGSSLNESAGFAVSAVALDGIPSFATNFTDQSRPVVSLRSASSCRRLFKLASASIFDLSSGECPSKKLRPSVPTGRTKSLNVRKTDSSAQGHGPERSVWHARQSIVSLRDQRQPCAHQAWV